MDYIPLSRTIVVIPRKEQEKKSLLIIPGDKKEGMIFADVVSIGSLCELGIQVGDVIMIQDTTGFSFKDDPQGRRLMAEKDAIVKVTGI